MNNLIPVSQSQTVPVAGTLFLLREQLGFLSLYHSPIHFFFVRIKKSEFEFLPMKTAQRPFNHPQQRFQTGAPNPVKDASIRGPRPCGARPRLLEIKMVKFVIYLFFFSLV